MHGDLDLQRAVCGVSEHGQQFCAPTAGTGRHRYLQEAQCGGWLWQSSRLPSEAVACAVFLMLCSGGNR